MTDLAARINFVSSKLGLTVAEQNRLHTFRLASNAVLNRQAEPSREKLLRDAKTVSFFVKRITGEDIPADLYRLFPQADATYIAAPPAKERVRLFSGMIFSHRQSSVPRVAVNGETAVVRRVRDAPSSVPPIPSPMPCSARRAG